MSVLFNEDILCSCVANSTLKQLDDLGLDSLGFNSARWPLVVLHKKKNPLCPRKNVFCDPAWIVPWISITMFVNLKYNFPSKWSTISCSVILNSSVNNISPPMESIRRGVTSALFSVELHNQGVNSEDGKVLCARRADVIHTLEQVREMQVALFVACGCNWIKQREKDLLFECTSAQNNHDLPVWRSFTRTHPCTSADHHLFCPLLFVFSSFLAVGIAVLIPLQAQCLVTTVVRETLW